MFKVIPNDRSSRNASKAQLADREMQSYVVGGDDMRGEIDYDVQMINEDADVFGIWNPAQRNSVMYGIWFLVFLVMLVLVFLGIGAIIAYNSTDGVGDSHTAFMINLENSNLKAMICANAARDVVFCQFLSAQFFAHTGYNFDCDPSVITDFYPSFCPKNLKLLDSSVSTGDIHSILDSSSASFSHKFESLASRAEESTPSTTPHSHH